MRLVVCLQKEPLALCLRRDNLAHQGSTLHLFVSCLL